MVISMKVVLDIWMLIIRYWMVDMHIISYIFQLFQSFRSWKKTPSIGILLLTFTFTLLPTLCILHHSTIVPDTQLFTSFNWTKINIKTTISMHSTYGITLTRSLWIITCPTSSFTRFMGSRQGPRNRWSRWSTCFTGIQRFYYREIFSILNIWRGKFIVLHRKKARSAAPAY